jgi:hypothetical protein
MAQSLRHALEAKILAGAGPFKGGGLKRKRAATNGGAGEETWHRFNHVAALPANQHLKVVQF